MSDVQVQQDASDRADDESQAAPKGERQRTGPTFVFEPQEVVLYEALLQQLSDESEVRREVAAWALGELRYKSANKSISRVFTHDDSEFVRIGCAQALEKIGDSWSVQAIIRGLKDTSLFVREICVTALGRLHDNQAIYPLEQMLKRERDEHLRSMVEEVLEHISGGRKRAASPWERKVFKYLRMIEREPENANAHYNLAVSYFHAKRFTASRKYCKRARELGANVDWIDRKLIEIEKAEIAEESAKEALKEEESAKKSAEMSAEGAPEESEESAEGAPGGEATPESAEGAAEEESAEGAAEEESAEGAPGDEGSTESAEGATDEESAEGALVVE